MELHAQCGNRIATQRFMFNASTKSRKILMNNLTESIAIMRDPELDTQAYQKF